MEIRRAAAGDLAGVRAIAASYGNLADWPERPDYLDLELESGGLWVALEGGAVAGFAGVLRYGGIAHLGDLFVRRDALGRGIGRRLLAAALPADGTRITFASRDERALPVYVRAGMRPLAPLLYLTGTPAAGGPAVERVPVGELAARDAAASRRPRPDALAFLERAGAYGLRTGAAAYAVVRPAPGGAWVGPAAGDADELLALLGAAGGHGTVQLALGGPHPALAALLEARFAITDADTYMASDPDALDLTTYVPHPDLG